MGKRRICPTVLVVPLESLEGRRYGEAFLDRLADITPTVEPVDHDAAYADVTDLPAAMVEERLDAWAVAAFHLHPKIGFGVSHIAALTCAACGLPLACLPEADVIYLGHEDLDVTARLRRLGLTTFGLSRS